MPPTENGGGDEWQMARGGSLPALYGYGSSLYFQGDGGGREQSQAWGVDYTLSGFAVTWCLRLDG